MMKLHSLTALTIVACSLFTAAAKAAGPSPQGKLETDETTAKKEENRLDQQALFRKFEETLTGVKLVGQFTVLGKKEDGPLAKEEYTIRSVKKLPDGDYWIFNARIKYGQQDLTLPLPLEVKWAGDTPIITLTDLTIPGVGACSARVVIYDNKYAGTWSHSPATGHLFGVIEKLDAKNDTKSAKTDD